MNNTWKTWILPSIIMAVMIFIIMSLSMLNPDVGFEIYKDPNFWRDFLINNAIGIMARAILFGRGIEFSRITDEYKTMKTGLLTLIRDIMKYGLLSRLGIFIDNRNKERILKAKLAVIDELSYHKNEKTAKKYNAMKQEYLKTNDEKVLKVKVTVDRYKVRQVVSANSNAYEKDSLKISLSGHYIKQSLPGFIMIAILILLFQGLDFGGGITLQGAYMAAIRMLTMTMGLISGYNGGKNAVMEAELPLLQTKYGIIQEFNAWDKTYVEPVIESTPEEESEVKEDVQQTSK